METSLPSPYRHHHLWHNHTATIIAATSTNSRPEFVEHQIGRILAQDYPRDKVAEVIVVDDSPPHLLSKTLSDDHDNLLQYPDGRGALTVRYVTMLSPQRSIGYKRNLAADMATGDIIAHWGEWV